MRMPGFSLVELLVTLALLAILAGLGIPSLSHQIQAVRAKKIVAELTRVIRMGQTAALSDGSPVVYCPSQDNIHCGGAWSNTRILFVDNNDNKTRDKNERLLRVFPALAASQQLRLVAFPSSRYLKILPSGLFTQHNGSFYYCPKKASQWARAVKLSRTGRLRVSQHEAMSYC